MKVVTASVLLPTVSKLPVAAQKATEVPRQETISVLSKDTPQEISYSPSTGELLQGQRGESRNHHT